MRAIVLLALFGALLLVGCVRVPEASESRIVYEETLSLAGASDDRTESFDVPAGHASLTVLISGRNSAGTGSNARIELFDPAGRGGGHCICGGGMATDGTSSFGSGGRADAEGTWTLEIDAMGSTAIHLVVRADPRGSG